MEDLDLESLREVSQKASSLIPVVRRSSAPQARQCCFWLISTLPPLFFLVGNEKKIPESLQRGSSSLIPGTLTKKSEIRVVA